MAALRLNYPGQPVRFLDLGPCPAHVTAQGFAIRGGPIDVTAPRPATTAQLKAAQNRARPPIEVARCLAMIRGGEHCWRRVGHSLSHSSKASVERDNARRRTRDFG